MQQLLAVRTGDGHIDHAARLERIVSRGELAQKFQLSGF